MKYREAIVAKLNRPRGPMALYAISACYAPGNEVEMLLASCDEDALDRGVYVAAKDIVDGGYFSPTADVYKVTTEGLAHVGEAKAADAPAEWEWAHPEVEEFLERHERFVAGEDVPSYPYGSPIHPFEGRDLEPHGSPPYFDMVDLRGFGSMFGKVGDTMHIVAMGPGLANFLSRDRDFNHDNPKASLADTAAEIMEHGGELPMQEGDVGPRIWSADITVYDGDGRDKVTVWAEQVGETNTATIFFPSER